MLIDLTRKPLIIMPEECPTSVVVRSIGDHVVTGLLTVGPSKPMEATASIARGGRTLYETRLPLRPNPSMEQGPAWGPASRWGRGPAPRYQRHVEPTKVNIAPEPFEVATVCIDPVTGVSSSWRIGLRIERVEKMKRCPWVVSILDATTGMTLSTIAVSTLNPDPEYEDPLPLTRAIKEKAHPTTNAWTRLLDDDGE